MRVFHRAVYKPAGFYPRTFTVEHAHTQMHGQHAWLCGTNAVTGLPLHLLLSDVTALVEVPA